jgi:autoinducer 2-degrading protein
MYVVTVDFTIRTEHAKAFLHEMKKNAKTSAVIEPGCRRFDVCIDPNDMTIVFLYEIYDSRAAFEAHLASAHFKEFESIVAPWVSDKRVRTLSLET